MDPTEKFFDDLAQAIVEAGGSKLYNQENALPLARQVWAQLQEMGQAYPAMVGLPDDENVRIIHLWEQLPHRIIVMMWDDEMWRNIKEVRVPREFY